MLCCFGIGVSFGLCAVGEGGDLHRFPGMLDQTLCNRKTSLFSRWHGHSSHAKLYLFVGVEKGALGFAQGYTVNLGLLLHGHGKPTSKILLASSCSSISELGFLSGLGF